jgi:hypothetical protein
LEDSGVVESVADLIAAIGDLQLDGTIWFRGHGKASYQLIPSLARSPESIKAELALFKRFRQNASPYLQAEPKSDWDWMFIMQHYRVPTRLLDWTENPLAAAYFAVEEHPEEDGCIWCLLPQALNDLAGAITAYEPDILFFGIDDYLENYLPAKVSGPGPERRPVAAIAPRQFDRLSAQAGVFTITHREQTPLEDVGDASHLRRLRLPAAGKERIQRELQLVNISSLTLFPELPSVAAHARSILT